jgi:hypothetical protein
MKFRHCCVLLPLLFEFSLRSFTRFGSLAYESNEKPASTISHVCRLQYPVFWVKFFFSSIQSQRNFIINFSSEASETLPYGFTPEEESKDIN